MVQGQPLYSNKYHNDRSPARATKYDQYKALQLTTSNYVIAEELFTGPDGPAARHSVTFRPFYEALSVGFVVSGLPFLFSSSPSSFFLLSLKQRLGFSLQRSSVVDMFLVFLLSFPISQSPAVSLA